MNSLQTSIILEGGGIRGIYTAGVLDFFLENKLKTDALFGVSAGIINGINYISEQKGRSLRVNTEYLHDKRYLSLYSLITTGNIFGVDFCYNMIPNSLQPFDYEKFQKSPIKCYATVSNLVTGQAEYKLCTDMHKDMLYVRASASLPLVSQIVKINGSSYLDGGICDSIPLAASIHHGYKKHIVVLTRPENYRKKPSHMSGAIAHTYHDYPNFIRACRTRHLHYNRTLDFIETQEKAGNAFVIRPSRLIHIGRLEKNPEKIHAMYELGYHDAKRALPKLLNYVEA